MSESGKIEIDERLLKVIQNSVTAGVNEGVRQATKEIEEKRKKAIESKYDRKVRDTKLLLSHYRKFKKHIKETIYTEEQLDTSTTSEILDRLYILEDDEKDDLTIVQSILKSKKRTEIILNHVDNIIKVYMTNAIHSKNIEMKRRANVINKLFIDGKKGKSYEEIANEEHTSVSSVKRDKNRAITEIAVLMFGIDGIRFD